MNALVQITSDNKLRTTSRIVAQVFGKAHRDVLRAVRSLDTSDAFNLRNFALIDFTDAKGRVFQEYSMTRDGCSVLIMGFTGPKAGAFKEQFVEAFSAMEDKLSKQEDRVEWKMARLQGKAIRSALTDTLQDFVAYAKAQGSENADRYYGSITLMEYKALSLIEKGAKVGKNFRDTLDGMQVATLTVAENVARQVMRRCMDEQMHYKDIYYVAKHEVEKLADVVKFTPMRALA